MAHLLVVSPAAVAGTSDEAPVSALALLPHSYALVPPDASVVNEAERYDVIVLDGRTDLPTARQMCRLLAASGTATPTPRLHRSVWPRRASARHRRCATR